MMTKKSESTNCPMCQSDPCECGTKACGVMKSCMGRCSIWGSVLRIAIAVGLIVGAFCIGARFGSGHIGGGYGDDMGHRGGMMMQDRGNWGRPSADRMPMMNHSGSMESMSMADMSKMLAGKTGDDLNKSFLEGMIPHHQAAVDMAQYLAASNKPELVKLGGEIIATQTKEIEQMKKWMQDWGYNQSGTTSTGAMNMHVMPDGTMMHN